MLAFRSSKKYALVVCLLCVSAHIDAAILNFKDVEIRQIIESVGELTGKNFLIDNRIKGKVTLISTTETPDDQAYDVMLTVLRMYGFRAVEGPAGITRIVPANVAPRYSPLNQSEGLISKIIPIQHINASTIVGLVKPLLTSQAKTAIHKETNALIIIESQSNIERVEDLLKSFDKPAIGSYEIIDLEYLKAKEVSNLIGRARNKNTKHLVTVVADNTAERIILTGAPEFRLPLRALIVELDAPPRMRKGQEGLIQIVHLNYANAEEMGKTLKGLLTKQFLELAQSGGTFAGSGAGSESAKATTTKKDTKTSTKKKDTKKTTTEKKSTSKTYTIQADPATNSLIIGGSINVVASILSIIKELDVPRPQVLIEAIIVEMTLNKSAALQTQLVARKKRRGETEYLSGPLENVGNKDNPRFEPAGGITNLEGLFTAFDFIGAPVAQYAIGGTFDGGRLTLGLLINAIRTDSNTNILSTPSILTLNNEKAILKVGGERSFITGSITGSGGDSATANTFTREPVTNDFEVTPQITKGDAVRLNIKQVDKRIDEAEALAIAEQAGGRDTSDRVPTLKREIQTNVVVNDRDVVVLGGMTRDNRVDRKSEIPLLSDIPIIGNLFRGRSSSSEKLTLMVFVRPTIFRRPEDVYDGSKVKYAQLRLQQLQGLKRIDSLIDVDEYQGSAILPPLKTKRKASKKKKRIKKYKRKVKQSQNSQ